jgi:hypothetical protein
MAVAMGAARARRAAFGRVYFGSDDGGFRCANETTVGGDARGRRRDGVRDSELRRSTPRGVRRRPGIGLGIECRSMSVVVGAAV